MRITWMADTLRAAGLTVVEHDGWQDRAAGGSWQPAYGIVHATAAPHTQPDDTQVRIVRDGRQGLPGPIANACVDRAGRWHILAAGRCNTTLVGTAGPYRGLGNTNALGVEACNDNRSEPWPAAQYQALVRGWAAIAYRLDWTPKQLRGHREHTPGHKTDPTFDLDRFRDDVATAMRGDDVSKTEVLDALDDATPWVSAGVRTQATAAGWGNLSLRAMIEHIWASVQFTTPTALAGLLTAIADDPDTSIDLTDGQVDELARLLAARLPQPPTPAQIADAVNDDASARLGS